MIYVASSWRNKYQPGVVKLLRNWKLPVYDFRNPEKDNHGFQWSDIDPRWEDWSTKHFIKALEHPIAEAGYKFDMDALEEAEAIVLVLPSGRSAHLEAGYGIGNVPVLIYSPEPCEPELMYKMATCVSDNLEIIAYMLSEFHHRHKV